MRPAPEFSSQHSEVLHRLRGVLALVVLVNHVRQLWWTPYDQLTPGERSLPVVAFYFVTAFGPAAVTVFFVLSGYLITRGYLPRLLVGALSLPGFLGGRAVRLYTVLLPTLVLSGFLAVWRGAAQGRDLTTLLANLAFLMPNVAPVYADNIPLWSLGYEGRAYIVFALVASSIAAYRNKKHANLILLLVAVGVITVVGGAWNAHYFAVWGLGALAALGERGLGRLQISPTFARRACWFAGGLSVGALVAARCGLPSPIRDWIIGVPSALFFALLGFAALSDDPPRGRSWGRRLSESSFSLYITHFPILLALRPAREEMLRPGFEAMSWFVGGTAVCVVFGWLFSLGTEAHTASLKRWLGLSKHAEQ